MSILVDKLDSIMKKRIGNIEFNTDFRIGILFETMMKDPLLSKEDKLILAINLFYKNPIQINDYEKAIEDILWFYCCGKEEKDKKNNKSNSADKKEYIYDYEYDDGYIYSAFLQQYGIDLQEIDYLHWWKFKSMFNSLNKDTKIVEIMGYRALNLKNIKDKKEKKRYSDLKEMYELPDMRTAEQKEKDFSNAFW